VRIAVVVNASSRRGSGRVAELARRWLPNATILLSHTLDELDAFARELVARPPDLVLAAGGDGTAIGIVNAVRRAERVLYPARVAGRGRRPLGPVIAALKLGTGNAWARGLGAPDTPLALELIAELDRNGERPPIKRFDLVEVEGKLAHFTGTGWDAEIISDFHAQKSAPSFLSDARKRGLAGYLNGMFMRTIPRNIKQGQPEVRITNLGSDAMTVSKDKLPVSLRSSAEGGAPAGTVLYEGPSGVCGIGTSPQWGYGFVAFPFAGLVEGRFNLRNYGGGPIEALLHSPWLWAGSHPVTKMDCWLLDKVRLEFSRKVPFQLGGDLLGDRDTVDYSIADEYVHLVHWSALRDGVRLLAPSKPRSSRFQGEPALA
jgi:hypothetical protein